MKESTLAKVREEYKKVAKETNRLLSYKNRTKVKQYRKKLSENH